MSHVWDLKAVDLDGAIQEADAAVEGDTRAQFFRKAAIGGGSVLAAGSVMGILAEQSWAAPSRRQDTAILNYALTLEYLEDAFYTQALNNGTPAAGDVLESTKIVQDHERVHVNFLKKTLGASAVKKPTFDFGAAVTDPAMFLATSVVLEDTGVKAYSGQATRILSPTVVKAAVSILTVEARHASRFRSLASKNFAPLAFDRPASMRTILAAVKKTGFIKS